MASETITRNDLKNILDQVLPTGSLIDMFYPVGSYYETSSLLFDPTVTWGGTWVLETEGQVHVSSGTNYAVSGAWTNTSDGGASTHTLTEAQLPSITGGFSVRRWNSSGGGSMLADFSGHASLSQRSGTSSYTVSASTSTAVNNDKITYKFGSGQAHNNMQPYIVVNRWHRTA